MELRVWRRNDLGYVSGIAMIGFLAGVGLHSLRPFWEWNTQGWMLVLGMGAVGCVLLRATRGFVVSVVIFALLVGAWRLDVGTRPSLRHMNGRWFMGRLGKEDAKFIFTRMRNALTDRISLTIPHDEAMLVTGILYGDQDLSREQRTLYRHAGLAHLVAVSGSNVTVLVLAGMRMGARFQLRRRMRFFVLSVLLVLFVCFTGSGSAVIRAALMGWLFLLAREVGRIASPVRLLLVAATVMILWNPWHLAFDIGFALSFLAMLGLIVVAPSIDERFVPYLPWKSVREIMAMTLAATLLTLPYLAWVFQRVTFAGLITNLFALPLIPFVMGFGSLTALWGTAFGSSIVALPTIGLAYAIEGIARVAEWMPWLELSVMTLSGTEMIAIYVCLGVYWKQICGKKLSTSTREELDNLFGER